MEKGTAVKHYQVSHVRQAHHPYSTQQLRQTTRKFLMDFMLQMSTDEYSFQTAQTWVGFETQSQNKETILDNRALSFNVSCQSEASEDFPLTGSCFETGPA